MNIAGLRQALYTGCLLVCALLVTGCGKAKEPPPGAPTDATPPPTVDLGSDSTMTETPPDTGAPKKATSDDENATKEPTNEK